MNNRKIMKFSHSGYLIFYAKSNEKHDLTKKYFFFSELSYSINYTSSINVWEYSFAPREYLNQHLETRFARALAGMVMFSPETSEIAKPSELLTSVRIFTKFSIESEF